MMKTAFIWLAISLTTVIGADTAYQPSPDSIWPIVAESDIIVTGTLSVPVEKIQNCLKSKRHEYVEIDVTTDQTLKGEPQKHLMIHWYTEANSYSPTPERVISLDSKRGLLFLVHVDDPSVAGYYFAGRTPKALSNSGDHSIDATKHEIAVQDQMLVEFKKTFPSSGDPLSKKVKDLIDATTRNKSQEAAFRELEELGPKAVPAIIMLMDDRRNLAIPEISLANKSPKAFEGMRHYGPKKVVDAMAAILNQITGQSFRDIYNSGSDKERQAAVNCWRIYLYYLKKEKPN